MFGLQQQQRQQQQHPIHSLLRDCGNDKAPAEPGRDFGIGCTLVDAGKGLELSFDTAAHSHDKDVEPGKQVGGVSVENTPTGQLFVRRPDGDSTSTPRDAAGYPAPTRTTGRTAGHAKARGPERRRQHHHHNRHHHQQHARTQSELRGFEIRVIDTHGGKAVVRTPILTCGGAGDLPALPPLNAAERRFNAQRALISTTSVLRSVVAAKDHPGKRKFHAQSASVGSGADSIAAFDGLRRNTNANGFHINMQFELEHGLPPAGPARMSDISSAPDDDDAYGVAHTSAPAAPTGVLEQWGIPAVPPRTPSARARAGSGYDSDGAAVSTVPGGTLRARASSVILSDESQRLIDSVFGGRLSIESAPSNSRRGSTANTGDRLGDSTAARTIMTPPPKGGAARQEPSAASSRARFGAAWTQPSQSPRLRPQEPGERDGSKMRKPSFWSIFRGGSGRKDADDDKRDPSPESSSAAGRSHIIRKQQSTSSGFAETIGFSKRLNPNDPRFGAVLQSQLLTNKDLPPSPRPKEPTFQPEQPSLEQRPTQQPIDQQLLLLQDQQPDQKPPPRAAALAKSTADCRVANNTPCADRQAAAIATAHGSASALPAARPSSASGCISGMHSDHPASTMAFAPDSVADSGTGGLRASAAAQRRRNSSIDSQLTTGDARMASTYYEPMLPADAAGRHEYDAASQQAGPPDGSLSDALKHDSAAADAPDGAELAPSDDDSDLVPLYRSRVLAEHDTRGGSGAGAAGSTGNLSGSSRSSVSRRAPGGAASGAALPEADGAGASAPADGHADAAATKPRSQLAPVQTRGTRAPSLDSVSPGSRMRFSPNNPVKMFASDQPQEATPSLSGASAALEDPAVAEADAQAAPAAAAADGEDNSTLARAMGQYLYDLEDYYCALYGSQVAGRKPSAAVSPEPARPERLQGVDVPALVDHAEWLGKREIFNALTLRYYIACYDFAGLRIDECLRRLCSHIFLRGESQVIDRLLVALAQRYVECNQDTKLLSADVAHAVTYSTLLLNTDLHIADIRSIDRMTRSRFVRNTIDTIAQFQNAAVTTVAAAQDTPAEEPPMWSPPPQLPELDLSKQSMDAARAHTASFATDAGTPHSAGPRVFDGQPSSGGGAAADAGQGRASEPSTLRSLVGSMTSLSLAPVGSTVPRSSRDVVRLMGGRGKRFSFFESSSSSNSGSGAAPGNAANNNSALAAAAAASSAAVAAAAASSPAPAAGAPAATHAASSPSSLRAFDRLRRKVSTSGAHARSRSGTLSLDETPVVANGRSSISGASHSSSHREMDARGGMVGRAATTANAMPNLAELTSILKDVYTGIKNKPLGQPLFARHANILYHQLTQHQRAPGTSGAHEMGHGSHELLYGSNMRSSMALGGGKHSLEIDPTPPMHGRSHLMHPQGPHTAYLDYDSHSSVGTGATGGRGRPSSARSVPLHSVQCSQSITSMNMGADGCGAVQGAGMPKRPPHHPDLRVGTLGAEAIKRSGSSMINFGGSSAGGGGMMRSSASSASMGMGYMPSSAYAAYMRSPIENQHIRSGVLVRKHLFERAGKKASHRAWRTCYVSVDRGTVAMYKMDGRHGGHPDGRELTDTSLQLGSVSLRHTMTHMLPPPGYSRSRPHVFALQLPSGGVYLFQTASEVELRDWVAACNYWAARESKAPYMIGGVYNMEYGWDNTGDFTLRFDERELREDHGEVLSPAAMAADERRIMEEREASKGVNILEWAPPNNPMQRSDLDEAAQLKTLMHHIAYLEEELVAHKKVQGSIDERFFPKTQQFQRAFSNWERKAQYILQELIKYQSYADVLQKTLKQIQDEATPPIPEETGGENSSTTTVTGISAPRDESDEGCRGAAHTPRASGGAAAVGTDGSRPSLTQSGGGRRGTDSNGQHTPSKALPIKELLAPAGDKVRHRTSMVAHAPLQASPAGTGSPGKTFDERRHGSQPLATAATTSGSPAVS
ncbi:hypothetical protein LPJ61_001999 [Coemansia biformis]|uniref:SEC7 domain-containing protein n=1 Tax=Coemansia biformis TaxID=1286918 RepID=A0A9W8CZ25_9FUNG|nr:hypothetical protein LPJ61_001999 [Coemansia biformis]